MIVKIFHWFTLINRRLYLSYHPQLWGKSISINGIPLIANIENIIFGKGLSLNEKVFIQGVGGGNNWEPRNFKLRVYSPNVRLIDI